jgi:hypothetical protein
VRFEDRFWAKVAKKNECWEWIGASRNGRYGSIWFNGKIKDAHRVSWILHFGSIPDGMFVLHKCDNGKCVRPDHLFLGTQGDNARDMHVKGRWKAPDRRGEKSGRFKLTWDAVRQIRRIRMEVGLTHQRLAIEFGVSASHIGQIVRNLYWKEQA